MMDILFLSAWYPYPPTNGSKLRIYHLLRGLSAHHNVTLLSFVDGEPGGIDKNALAPICKDVVVVPKKVYNQRSLWTVLPLLGSAPRSLAVTYSHEMDSRIQDALLSQPFDLMIASELQMSSYSKLFAGFPAILEDLELGAPFDKALRRAPAWKRMRRGLTWKKLRQYVARSLKQFTACTVVSNREREILQNIIPDFSPIQVIPNGLVLDDYRGVFQQRRPGSIIFSGSFRYRPNYDGMSWFMREVYPLVLGAFPALTISVTGDHAGLPLSHHHEISFTGFVPDVRTPIASHQISIVPVWEGSGTRMKLLEAMALQTPVVSTSKGAEGLEVVHGEHLLIADTPGEFAEAVLRLLNDEALRNRLAENALALVKEKYNWDVILPRFLDLVETVVSG